MKNMCEGIKTLTGIASNIIELTKADNTQYAQNRRTMCPKGWCADGVRQYLSEHYPTGVPSWAEQAITAAGAMQCDEFPFARTVEGGNLSNGTRRCIPASDNNWQGGTLSKYFKKMFGSTPNPDFIDVGEKFIVVIAGWDCETNTPDPNDLLGLLNATSTLKSRDAFANSISVRGGRRFGNLNFEHG